MSPKAPKPPHKAVSKPGRMRATSIEVLETNRERIARLVAGGAEKLRKGKRQ